MSYIKNILLSIIVFILMNYTLIAIDIEPIFKEKIMNSFLKMENTTYM